MKKVLVPEEKVVPVGSDKVCICNTCGAFVVVVVPMGPLTPEIGPEVVKAVAGSTGRMALDGRVPGPDARTGRKVVTFSGPTLLCRMTRAWVGVKTVLVIYAKCKKAELIQSITWLIGM